jgi:hypothetical protein
MPTSKPESISSTGPPESPSQLPTVAVVFPDDLL